MSCSIGSLPPELLLPEYTGKALQAVPAITSMFPLDVVFFQRKYLKHRNVGSKRDSKTCDISMCSTQEDISRHLNNLNCTYKNYARAFKKCVKYATG